jgi:hypothetical protein
VAGPKSKPKPRRKLEEEKRLTKEERREAGQEKLAIIPEKALQNSIVLMMSARAYIRKEIDSG